MTVRPVQAAGHWELALGVNPLHPEGWFALGYCTLKLENYSRAAQAFSRAAQQQPDNGDAWNNLAAIHLQVRPLLTWGSKTCALISGFLRNASGAGQ